MRFILILALTAGFVMAQNTLPNQNEREERPQERGMMQGGMSGMMDHCRMHCQENMTATKTLIKQVDEARQSNDPPKMRAALDAVAKHHAEMKKHMHTCMQNMQNMKSMGHGAPGAGQERGTSGSAQQDSRGTRKQ
jgi:hypothetical protein